MMDKLTIIAAFSGLMAVVYGLCMHSIPRKGLMHAVETLFSGIILCYLCQTILSPFGFQIAQSPLAALSAGYWGLPGAAFASVLALWP